MRLGEYGVLVGIVCVTRTKAPCSVWSGCSSSEDEGGRVFRWEAKRSRVEWRMGCAKSPGNGGTAGEAMAEVALFLGRINREKMGAWREERELGDGFGQRLCLSSSNREARCWDLRLRVRWKECWSLALA